MIDLLLLIKFVVGFIRLGYPPRGFISFLLKKIYFCRKEKSQEDMGLGNLELIVLGDVNAVDDVVSRDGNNTKLVEITDLDSNDVLFDVVHISDDDYHIYAHHRTFILVSEPSRDHFRPTTPALKSSDTTVWTFHHKGFVSSSRFIIQAENGLHRSFLSRHSSIGYGIYSVKNKDTDRHFMGQNLEFRSIRKCSLIVQVAGGI